MADVPLWSNERQEQYTSFIDGMSRAIADWSPLGWELVPILVGLFLVGVIFNRWRRGRLRLSASQPETHPHVRGALRPEPRPELSAAMAACRGAFVGVAVFSGTVNILMLTGALFMMEIYDRVLPSRSIPTLAGLAILAILLFAIQGILDFIRGRILARIGSALDEAVSGRVFDSVVRLPLRMGPKDDGQQPLRDLDTIRSFLSGNGPSALFDLPWIPFYLLIIYAFHPVLGVTALLGALALVGLTVATELMTREPAKAATSYGASRHGLADSSRRNAEVITAMGMGGRLADRWQGANRGYLDRQQRVSDLAGGFGAISRTLRFMLQSSILGLGAWLVIHGQATAGIIIAGSILFGRAMAPVDAAIANARNFVSARQSWDGLSKLLAALPAKPDPLPLPDPHAHISVQGVTLAAPGGQRPLVLDASFALEAGTALGIIGPSGSGKSCLTRALVGAWQPLRGQVRLDGATLDQWSPEAIGRHIGYLPQDVELFAGSIAENIARFDPDADPDAIIAAAKAAGVHDLIVSFPEGYQTEIGDHGAALSAGQRQRVALARALYGDPFLVVLDEPNANLDTEGERALLDAIRGVKDRGGIAIVVAHRPNVLAAVDYILAMQNGRAQPLVTRDAVFEKLAGEGSLSLAATDAPARKPGVAAVLKRAAEAGSRPPDAVFTLVRETPDGTGGKPRLRIAASKPKSAPDVAEPTK